METRLSTIMSISSDAIIMANQDQRIVFFNKGAEQIFGYTASEVIGRPVDLLIPRRFSEKHKEHIQSFYAGAEASRLKGQHSYEILGLRRDGSEFPADASISKGNEKGEVLFTVILRDVTEHKKIQEELLKAMKLESIGLLAAGIAHNFNNILTTILGNVSLVKMEADPRYLSYHRLNESERGVKRAKDLAFQLLTFSKGGAPRKQVMSIVELLKESAHFALHGSNVRPEFDFPFDLWAADIDEGQMTQVVHNLVINAQQAMPQGGVILIKAENRTVDGLEAGRFMIRSGPYIVLSFQDTGKGIPKKDLGKIFDPFFTTKAKGSGLGLFSTYSIVNNHDGMVTVSSEVGVGTTFFVYLPAIHEVKIGSREKEIQIVRGSGRVLVLDDDEMVRNTTGALLQNLGYEVEYASTGEETIEQYEQAKETNRGFDALIIDLTLPGGMSGKETMQRLINIDPGVKAIIASGYSNDPTIVRYHDFGFKDYLAKPYQIGLLSRVLHRVLTLVD